LESKQQREREKHNDNFAHDDSPFKEVK